MTYITLWHGSGGCSSLVRIGPSMLRHPGRIRISGHRRRMSESENPSPLRNCEPLLRFCDQMLRVYNSSAGAEREEPLQISDTGERRYSNAEPANEREISANSSGTGPSDRIRQRQRRA